MKQILIIILLVLGYLSYSQESYFVEGKDYCGYVFTKEHSIYGFPPESNRCTLTEENIIQADLPCRPCSIYGNKNCLRGDLACLISITPQLVTDKIEEILSNK